MYSVVGIRVWKGAFGIKWWVYVCGGQNAREEKKKKKEGKVWMKEKAKNKKSPFKNNTTIFSQ